MRSINPALLLGKTKKVTITRSYSSGANIDPIPLSLPGYYPDIIVKILLNVTAGSSVSPATDFWAAVFQNMKIEASNLKPYFEADDGRYLHYENRLFSHDSITLPTLPAASATADVRWQYHIHPGDNWLDKFDITDIIATRGLSGLCFKGQWGTNASLGTGYTINSGEIELIINYVILQPNVTEVRAFPGTALPGATPIPSFWQPQWRYVKFRNINTVYPALSFEEDFLSGFFLRDVFLFVEDSTSALVNTILTSLQITDKEGYEFFNKDFTDILEDNMRDFELTSRLTGVIYLDLRDIFQKTRSGLYLADAKDVLWNFTIANVAVGTPAEITLWYRTHWRTKSRTDVVGKRPAEFAV